MLLIFKADCQDLKSGLVNTSNVSYIEHDTFAIIELILMFILIVSKHVKRKLQNKPRKFKILYFLLAVTIISDILYHLDILKIQINSFVRPVFLVFYT